MLFESCRVRCHSGLTRRASLAICQTQQLVARDRSGPASRCAASSVERPRDGIIQQPPARFKQSIGSVANRAVHSGEHDQQLWSDICTELFYHLRHQSPQNISLVLNALARISVHDPALLDHVANTLNAAWLCSFNVQDLALLCNSYARFSHPSERLFDLCAAELLWKLPDGGTQELALVAGSCAKLRFYEATLFRHVAHLTVRQLDEFGPRHTATVLHAFARMDTSPPGLFRALASRLAAPDMARELGVASLTQACFAVERAAIRHNASLMREVGRPLLKVLARRFLALGQGRRTPLEPRHIGALACACLQAGAQSQQLVITLTLWLLSGPEAKPEAVSPRESGIRCAAEEAVATAEALGGIGTLLDMVDAAAALRESLGRMKQHGGQEQVEILQELLAVALRTLVSGRQSERGGATLAAGERRRLAKWDECLLRWFPEEWPKRVRPSLGMPASSKRLS